MVHTSLESYFYLDNNIFNELQVLIKSTGSIFIFPCSEMTVQGGTLTALEKVDETKWKNCSKWIKLIHFVHFELLLRKISKYLENVIVFGANGEKSQFCLDSPRTIKIIIFQKQSIQLLKHKNVLFLLCSLFFFLYS